MPKVIAVSHSVSTWNLTQGSAPGGLTKTELDAMVAEKLAEGWNLPEGNVILVRANLGERGELTHLINEYIFVKYEKPISEDSPMPAVKSKKDA